MKLVIVTGMSGAGKTIALKMLEDLGFYCVDNLPISLVDKFSQLAAGGGEIKQAALGIDIRSGECKPKLSHPSGMEGHEPGFPGPVPGCQRRHPY